MLKLIGKDAKTMHEQTLPDKLRMLRKSKGYSQDFVAGQLNISRQGYQHYESGIREPDTRRLMKLAELYHLQLFELVSNEIELNPEDFVSEAYVYNQDSVRQEQRLIKAYRRMETEEKQKLLKYLEAMARIKK